jgi:chromosome segregation ATPase
MQLDDRDIICETDYSPLSHAELVAQIEWHASAMSGATAYDLERITGPARALLARAEAAEAEAARLRDGLAAMSERVTLAQRSASLAENALGTARSRWEEAERREKSIFDSAMGLADQRDSLAARVAELEATLISNSELDNGPWHVLSETVAERNRLADRVAELEAAQQWRPAPAPQEPTP